VENIHNLGTGGDIGGENKVKKLQTVRSIIAKWNIGSYTEEQAYQEIERLIND